MVSYLYYDHTKRGKCLCRPVSPSTSNSYLCMAGVHFLETDNKDKTRKNKYSHNIPTRKYWPMCRLQEERKDKKGTPSHLVQSKHELLHKIRSANVLKNCLKITLYTQDDKSDHFIDTLSCLWRSYPGYEVSS